MQVGGSVLGVLISAVLMALAWLPRRLLRALRGAGARSRVVVLHLDEPLAQVDLEALLEELRALAEDRTCRGLLLRLEGAPLGWADAVALADALAGLRAAGLLVLVHLEGAGNADLLVAAEADRVWLVPASEVHLCGVGAELAFYGEALRRLGVEVELVSAGAYKSYGEMFSRAFPTSENREATAALVGDLQAQLVQRLAAGRRLKAEAVEALMARSPLPAEEALAAGLVDGLCYPDQVERAVEDLLARDARWSGLGWIAFWRRQQGRLDRLGRPSPRVVVVHLEGSVVAREQGRDRCISAERVVPVLEALAEEDGVRAVVLAIDSPGGGALPSDNIARAVARLALVKPVIAAMGGVAASGGYYIAAPCLEIVAQPATITGSIGVVGGKLVLEGAVARVGVFHERVEAGPNGGVYGPWAPFTPEQRARFQASLARAYSRFLGVVAAGRRRPVHSVEPVAQGRVWTGRQALELGLVDRLGGVDLAVSRAKARAGLRRARVLHLDFPPPRLHALARLAQLRFGLSLPGAALLARLGERAAWPSLLLESPGQPLAMLPWRIDGAAQSSP